ncbi:MAG: DUF5615 family PIN-like protein [Anaerolineae bacterium]|nr:DUF5615 family PIN-like protein [Anaerolineae bacterium]
MSRPLRYYMDTHIPKVVAFELRRRGIDVVRCEEIGLAEAADETHLQTAVEQERTLVSRDTDFVRLHADWLQLKRQHYGILFLKDYLQGSDRIGSIVRILVEYHQLVKDGAASVEMDFVNQLYFVG